MAKVKFDRSKPHLNVGTMGHIDHGKTTLTAAITKVAGFSGQADFRAYDQIDNAPKKKRAGSRSTLRTWNTKQTSAITRMWTCQVTATTSRT